MSPTGTEEVILAFAGPNGFTPYSSLVQAASGQLYGNTTWGGDLTACPDEGCGVMFGVSTSGVQTFLYQFTYSGGGAGPAPVIGADGNLYAVTSGGGAFSNGTMFSLTLDGVVTTLHAFGGNLQ